MVQKADRIGLLFTLYGICGILIQFFIFPHVARRFGVLPCLKVTSILFPIAYLLTPFTALLQSPATQQTTMFIILMIKSWAVIFAFPCSAIMLTNSAISLSILGTLNGTATSFGALGRAIGPVIGGWTFSFGVSRGYVILSWWTLAAVAALGAIPVWYLVEMEAFARDHEAEPENGSAETSKPPLDECGNEERSQAIATRRRDNSDMNGSVLDEDGFNLSSSPQAQRIKSVNSNTT